MNVTELLNSGKFYLGSLCFNKHDHTGGNQSVKRIKTDRCKECELETDKRFKLKHRERLLKESRKRYHKDIEESRRKEREYSNKNREKKRESLKKYRTKNREKTNQIAKEYRKNNPEKWKETKRKCYYKHREKNLEYNKKRNRKLREDNKKRSREWYLRLSPLQRQITTHRHRAKKYGCKIEKYTLAEAQAIFNNFNNECAYCGSVEKVGIDHYVALSNNGSESLNNLIPCCYKCNCSKHIKDGWEWYSKQESFSHERYQKILKSLGIIG